MTGAGSSAVQNQLTGLANRRSINDTLNNEWARASRHDRSLALVMLDVDFFRNTTITKYGHQAGDADNLLGQLGI